MLAPIAWRTPPRHYGPWERIVSLITEGLVDKGIDVTIFATADSITRAKLDSICPVSNVLAQIWRGSHNNPGLFYVLNNSAHFMQERITRSRLACDPPDIILAPNMRGIGFMDFHRAAEAIDIGKRCVERRTRDYAID